MKKVLRVVALYAMTLLSLHVFADDLSSANCHKRLGTPACQARECTLIVNEKNCSACLLKNPLGGNCLAQGTDPLCEAVRQSQNQGYARTKAICEVQKAQEGAQCIALQRAVRMANAQNEIDCRGAIKPKDFVVETDIDYPSERDREGISAPTQEVCEQLCREDESCRSFTFLPKNSRPENWKGPGGPYCWLKDIVPARKRYKGLVSGVRQARAIFVEKTQAAASAPNR